MQDTTRQAVGRFVSQALSFSAVLILLLSALLVLSDPEPVETTASATASSVEARS
jgi:exosortase/archaeosortase